MRKNVRTAIIVLVALIGGGAIGFVITGFATSGTIEESFTFHYQDVPSSMEDLTLDVGLGTLDIRYNTSNTPYLVKIDVDMKISGLFMANRDYAEFFGPSTDWWQNTTFPPITFRLDPLPQTWFNPTFWFKSYDIDVYVTLRTDVVYKINADTGTGSISMTTSNNVILNDLSLSSGTGSIDLSVSDNTTIQDTLDLDAGTGSIYLYGKSANFSKGLLVDAGTGSIVANLSNSIIGSDIALSTGTGSINFKTYHMEYTKNSAWSLSAGTGSIDIVINQHALMGANVTGTISTGTGSINIIYIDTSASVGASFYGSTGTGSYNRINTLGFTPTNSNPFRSLDFPTTYNYDFNINTGTGSITVNGSSN
ncbi:MAG: hypothetical protein ACFFDX_10250 [Candidatus Odinarchaeota archaeon]